MLHIQGVSMSFASVAGRQDLLIDGKRVASASGRTFTTVNPATEQAIAEVAEGDATDIDTAVRAARGAFEGPWGEMRAADRGRILMRFADGIRANQDELTELESLDAGKPI